MTDIGKLKDLTVRLQVLIAGYDHFGQQVLLGGPDAPHNALALCLIDRDMGQVMTEMYQIERQDRLERQGVEG